MLIYENENKLNINFENEIGNPDIVVGKDEVKIGDTSITPENTLPVLTEQDVGKTLVVDSNGKYALVNKELLIVTFSGMTADDDAACDKTFEEIKTAYDAGQQVQFRYSRSGEDYFLLPDFTVSDFSGTYLYAEFDENGAVTSFTRILCSITSDNIEVEISEL